MLTRVPVSRRSGADHLVDTEDFVAVRRCALGLQWNHGVLAGQVDGLGAVLEQVDRRCAEQVEICFADTQRVG
ncbi:hypothetical protein D3C71_1780190 [compost metagenome]